MGETSKYSKQRKKKQEFEKYKSCGIKENEAVIYILFSPKERKKFNVS